MIEENIENMLQNFSQFFVSTEKNFRVNILTEKNVLFKISRFYALVSPNCKRQRLWQVERTLGAILKDGHSNLYYQALLRRSECYEKCLQAGTHFIE